MTMFIHIQDDGRIAVATDAGVAVSEAPVPDPDERLLADLPDGSLRVEFEE